MPNPGDAAANKRIGSVAVSQSGRLARIEGSELIVDGAMIRRLWRGSVMNGGKWATLEPVFLCKRDNDALLEVWPISRRTKGRRAR